jgi:hypothetical protein
VLWAYRDIPEALARTVGFLVDGIRGGRMTHYAGPLEAGPLRDAVAERVNDVAALDDVLMIGAVAEQYVTRGRRLDVGATVALRASACSDALEAGFTGLRGVVDMMEIAVQQTYRSDLCELEHRLDRTTLGLPIATLCAIDGRAVDRAEIAKLASLHPVAKDGTTLVSITAGDRTDLVIAGEIGHLNHHQVEQAIDCALHGLRGDRERTITVDVAPLEFIDPRGLLLLDRRAGRAHKVLELHNCPLVVEKVLGILGIKRLRVASSARPVTSPDETVTGHATG